MNKAQQVQLMNAAACRLLGVTLPTYPIALAEIAPLLNTQVTRWLLCQESPQPFRNHHSLPEVKASMARSQEQGQESILIFLDDHGRFTQQAQLLKLKSLARLTASIAHEIRNPLGAISHAAQLLNESFLPAADLRLAEIIQHQSVRINASIENVLQLSRRQSPKLELIDLAPWLEKFIAEANSAHAGHIELIPVAGVWQGHFDASQLTQVLNNIYENGLRYSQRQTGIAHLVLRGGITDEALPFIEVQDNGRGISAEQKEHLFEPFYTSEPEGTGLGLFLAKELCEMNYATLALMPNDLPGCCFRITFAHPQRVLV
jgi:two-component system sensor histidine kinase PilS (NtrC family)